MKKRIIAGLLGAVVAVSLVGCGASKEETAAKEAVKEAEAAVEEAVEEAAAEAEAAVEEAVASVIGEGTMYVLTPTADHGWTGAISGFADDWIAVASVTYPGIECKHQECASADDQIKQIEDIIANYDGSSLVTVAMLPMDNTVENAMKQLVDAGIPFGEMDRLIEGVKDDAVVNVVYDNYQIGATAAAYLVNNGMKEGDAVIVLQGDNSSADTDRTDGFYGYLKGEAEIDGKTIETPWADTSSVIESGALGWSQAEAQKFVENCGDKLGSVKYIAGWDDGYTLGVFDALSGSAIDDKVKAEFLGNTPYITGCGGPEAIYSIIRGDSDAYAKEITDAFGGIMSVTYPPAMIQATCELMAQYMCGEKVEQDQAQTAVAVTKDNVNDFVGFE